jgi:hypothetical protein
MAKRNAGSPVQLAAMAIGRRMSARHQRRAAEAEARKEAKGLSIPAIKKLIRRNKQRQK